MVVKLTAMFAVEFGVASFWYFVGNTEKPATMIIGVAWFVFWTLAEIDIIRIHRHDSKKDELEKKRAEFKALFGTAYFSDDAQSQADRMIAVACLREHIWIVC